MLTLEEVAKWIDEEYDRLSPASALLGHDGIYAQGQLSVLADLAGTIRSWVATGKTPQHRPDLRGRVSVNGKIIRSGRHG